MKKKPKTTPLLDAVFASDLQRVIQLLAEGADINEKDRDGRTCLFQAIIQNDEAVATWLIENGADLTLPDDQGETALHHAARAQLSPLTRKLLEAGAPVNAQDFNGNTPLARAVFTSHGKGEVIQLLRESGADPDLKNHYDMSPRDLAASIGNYDVAKYLQ